MKKPFFSIQTRLIVACLLSVVAAWLVLTLGILYQWDGKWFVSASLLVALLLAACLVFYISQPLKKELMALEIGLLNFKDNEFSNSIASQQNTEFSKLAQLYNATGESLRKAKQSIYQRELLLDKIIQSSPQAMVLTDSEQRIIYSNPTAKHLILDGRSLEGHDFIQLLHDMPESMQDAVASGRDGLFTLPTQQETETYHLSQGKFLLNNAEHHLYLFKKLTKELNQQEVAIWKKVIRVISHELNNSLAPISSMTHSAKLMLTGQTNEQVDLVFQTIEERIQHLNQFIQGYAKFAKLPLPQKQWINWHEFLSKLKQHVDFKLLNSAPEQAAFLDPSQMEQVLINLLKNAKESGGRTTDITLQISLQQNTLNLCIKDKGQGMSEAVLQNALLPFYSTKSSGTGLGLPLCKEIIEGHQGKIALANRLNGGLKVNIWLPNQ